VAADHGRPPLGPEVAIAAERINGGFRRPDALRSSTGVRSLPSRELVQAANAIGGRHGTRHVDQIENPHHRGPKSRGISRPPGIGRSWHIAYERSSTAIPTRPIDSYAYSDVGSDRLL